MWLHPELVIRAEFAGWTGDGLVRQASYKGFDLGKDPQAIRREIARSRAPSAIGSVECQEITEDCEIGRGGTTSSETVRIGRCHFGPPDRTSKPESGQMDDVPTQSQPIDRNVSSPGDEGVGNVRPDETEPLGPGDEGVGNVRPDETEPLGPGDEGVGNVRS
jgi:hypothetical protein